MDISRWPMGRIMQLPDHCFGSRFLVTASVSRIAIGSSWDISEIAFPEHCVLWELNIAAFQADTKFCNVRLALGDQLPTVAAQMDTLEPLVPGLGVQGPDPRTLILRNTSVVNINRLRQPLSAMGRRLVLQVNTIPDMLSVVQVIVVVSSIPREVPDCLLSV